MTRNNPLENPEMSLIGSLLQFPMSNIGPLEPLVGRCPREKGVNLPRGNQGQRGLGTLRIRKLPQQGLSTCMDTIHRGDNVADLDPWGLY